MARKLTNSIMIGSFARCLAALLALLAFPAASQPVSTDHAEAELVASTDAVVPGQPLTLGLRIKHEPHWHTYWQVPGDSGLPTTIGWRLPQGFSAGAIQWPVPKRLPVGPLVNYGYEGELLLPVEVQVPAQLASREVTINARADWLICSDVCIPGGADLALTLPVRTEAGPSRRAALFAATMARIPRPHALAEASALRQDDRIKLSFRSKQAPQTLEFFPLEEARIEAAAPQVLQVNGEQAELYLTAAQPGAAEFSALKGVLVANGGPVRADQGGWAGVVEVPLQSGVVPQVGGVAVRAPAGAAAPALEVPGLATPSLWLALAGAFIGGLLLNLMPCVFPVLSLKLLSLLQHQRQIPHGGAASSAAALRTHGIAFSAGVVLSFVVLAALLIGLRAAGEQLGWGFQLQTPWVVALLTLLFFVIGLNLLGAFEFTFGAAAGHTGLAQRLQPDRLSGSFGTGVLAVLVAAPCTAPFMGAALGFALTQSAGVALLVFAFLGLGMAAPYLSLTCAPRLLQKLPRPGIWMQRFKQVMAFPMFATCVWLLWVLAQQVGLNAMALVLGGLVLVALAAWAFGIAQTGARRWRWVAAVIAPLALYSVIAPSLVERERATPGGAAVVAGSWQPWTRTLQDAHIARRAPIFVDFTAAWCVTCQANKQLVLNAPAVEQAFARAGVQRMRADWTNRNEEITRELARFNRNGVPLYVLYDARGQAQLLPELLSEKIVIEALNRARAAS